MFRIVGHLLDVDGGGEGVMRRRPTAVLGGFEGGEVDHKQRRQLLVAVGTAELDPELAEYGCHRPPVVGGEQQHVARFAVEGGDHSGSFLLGQELGHR